MSMLEVPHISQLGMWTELLNVQVEHAQTFGSEVPSSWSGQSKAGVGTEKGGGGGGGGGGDIEEGEGVGGGETKSNVSPSPKLVG